MPEPRELGDVAAEEERGRPVDDDADLPRDERQLKEVIAARDKPAGKATDTYSEHVRNPLVATERRHLPQHPVGVRTRLAADVLGESARLPERVLASRRVDAARCRLVRHGRTVAERPKSFVSLDAQEG